MRNSKCRCCCHCLLWSGCRTSDGRGAMVWCHSLPPSRWEGIAWQAQQCTSCRGDGLQTAQEGSETAPAVVKRERSESVSAQNATAGQCTEGLVAKSRHTLNPPAPPPRHCSDKPGERCFPKAERLKAAPKKLQRCTTQRACVQVCVCVRERERERGREREVERERGREREREVERERESCTSMTHTHTQHSTTPS